MPSLEEMVARATTPVPLPKASEVVTLVEGQHLNDQMERLERQKKDVIAAAAAKLVDEEEAESKERARKAAEKVTSDVSEVLARLNEEIVKVGRRLAEHQAEIGLSGMTPGAWERFKDANPPREIGRHETKRPNGDVVLGAPIYDPRDLGLGMGFVSFAAVLEHLDDFIETWDGDAITKGQWSEVLGPRVIPSSHAALARKIIVMHEQQVTRAPKSPSDSSATTSGTTD